MEILIYSYHFAVISIIIVTFIATILSMAKVGYFANVPQSTTKVLVSALVLELVGAFVGVYKTLPELKFDVSEKYRFEIVYSDLLTPWLENLSEEDKALITPFIHSGGMPTFLNFSRHIEKYRAIKYFSRINGTEWTQDNNRFLTDEQEENVRNFKAIFAESPGKIDRATELMTIYARLKGSSQKTGSGEMWASISGEKMEGIVVYTFPDAIQIPTVLEFDGEKKIKDHTTKLKLYFTQRMSALSLANKYFARPGGSFRVELELVDGAYIGELNNIGQIEVKLWEL